MVGSPLNGDVRTSSRGRFTASSLIMYRGDGIGCSARLECSGTGKPMSFFSWLFPFIVKKKR